MKPLYEIVTQTPGGQQVITRYRHNSDRYPGGCLRCYAYVGEPCRAYTGKPTRPHVGRWVRAA